MKRQFTWVGLFGQIRDTPNKNLVEHAPGSSFTKPFAQKTHN